MENEAKDYYSNIAAWYDRLLGVLIDPVRRALVEWIVTNQPGRVLDVGCGTGKQLALLPDNIDAVGIDISESMLEQAEKQVPGKC
ncbi:MAG: methyltransferase domain-containing protein, partial [FCB group bacterium]|nr:methyltransferase domain-containing protein [FCB group bacterium]